MYLFYKDYGYSSKIYICYRWCNVWFREGNVSLLGTAGSCYSCADLKVSCVKIDPYVITNAGTMNPLTHGEVFVTDDGGECDIDVGLYERLLDIN